MMRKLTAKQKLFSDEYLIDLNGTRAYKAAYTRVKSDKTAAVNASKLLRKANVSNYIQKAMDKRARRTEITQDRVLKEYGRIAFLNPKELFNDDGTLKPISDLSDDAACCIAGIVEKRFTPKGGDDYTKTELKIVSKLGALDSVAKHLGMFSGSKDIPDIEAEPIKVEIIAKDARRK